MEVEVEVEVEMEAEDVRVSACQCVSSKILTRLCQFRCLLPRLWTCCAEAGPCAHGLCCGGMV